MPKCGGFRCPVVHLGRARCRLPALDFLRAGDSAAQGVSFLPQRTGREGQTKTAGGDRFETFVDSAGCETRLHARSDKRSCAFPGNGSGPEPAPEEMGGHAGCDDAAAVTNSDHLLFTSPKRSKSRM